MTDVEKLQKKIAELIKKEFPNYETGIVGEQCNGCETKHISLSIIMRQTDKDDS